MLTLNHRRSFEAICLVVFLAQVASAQDTVVAGVVKDATGAVLPGVTVEASSPSLIEKSRTATTDGEGQYKIVRLVPGVYAVTFSLQGFTSVRREGIALQTDQTLPVNAELRVGAVEETITVSGASPVVDTQNVASRTVMSRDVMDAIPTGRNIQAVGILIPGTGLQGGGITATTRDVGGSGGLQQSPLSFRGATASIANVDGMPMSELSGVGQYTGYWNDGSFQEISFSTGADSAEIGQNGLRINMIPRDGGNSFNGVFFGNWTGGNGWNSNNLDDHLRALGTTSTSRVQKIYDANPGVGGPVIQNKLWFYGSLRWQGVYETIVDSYYNLMPNSIKYQPDTSRPGIDDGTIGSKVVRLTFQATPKNKVTGYIDRQTKKRGHWGLSSTNPPEASAIEPLTGWAGSTKWTSTLTNKLLFESGFGTYLQTWPLIYQSSVTPTTYRIVDQLSGRACCAYSVDQINEDRWYTFSSRLAWVSGSHNLSGGMQLNTGSVHRLSNMTGNLTMQYGLTSVNADASGYGPNQVTLILPTEYRVGIKSDTGFWITDKYTFKRATLTGGVRYDWFIGKLGDSRILSSVWSPERDFSGFSGSPNWKDLSPRLGVAYDLFGNGKTAAKFSASRYVNSQTVAFANSLNPINRLSNTVSLTWTDNSRDGTIFNPDGSVQDVDFNPNALIDPSTGQRQNELAPLSGNSPFGQLVSTTRIDPAVQSGFGVRGYTWEFIGGIQHELIPRVSLDFQSYRRNTAGNLLVTDDTRTGPNEFAGPYCVTTPLDPRLPGGGGGQLCGIYQPTQASLSVVTDNLQTSATTQLSGTGQRPIQYNYGFALTTRARLKTGTTVQGGVSADKAINDTCYLGALGSPQGGQLRNLATGSLYCHAVSPFLPDLKLLVSQRLPWDIQAAVTYQHTPGPAIQATWNITQAIANANGWAITTAAGATPAQVSSATTSVSLYSTGQQYGDPLNQLDFRTSKQVVIGHARVKLMADVYNILNSNWVYGLNTTLGSGNTVAPTWLRPTNILTARMLKIGTQIEF